MAKIGVLKPFRGTYSELKDIVLEEREIVFEIPSTGVGTGQGAIKMGDGVRAYKDLPYFLGTKTGGYSSGTTEEDLINNLNYISEEIVGKIYYIQAYYHNSSQYTEGTPSIETGMPYMVIGKNHDGTSGTVDLMSLVPADYRKYSDNYNAWSYGKYSTSKIYSWLSNTCPNGYSSSIRTCMQYMTERWREATGGSTGTMQSRQTKCKLLNPVELFGYSAATYDPGWQYASSSNHKTDFASPTGDKYGSLYPIWTDSITALPDRRIFHDKEMSTASYYWTNSWLAFRSSSSNAYCFGVNTDGSCNGYNVDGASGVAPVIRLSLS